MRFLSLVVNNLLLPPGLIVLFLLAAIALALLRRRRSALVVACAGCALVTLLSLRPVARALVVPLESRYQAVDLDDPRVADARAVVLLGSGTVGDDQLTAVALERAVAAALHARRLSLPVITTGGPPAVGLAAEADVAAAFLVSLGMAESGIVRETESRTTWENAARVRDLHPGGPLLLVTSALHMRRAAASFRAAGLVVIPAPSGRLLEDRPTRGREWLPGAGYLDASIRALHEYVGLLAYRVAYGVSLSDR